MSASFSNDGSDVIHRRIEIPADVTATLDLNEVYELDKCLEWIRTLEETIGRKPRVSLQFPPEMRVDAVRLSQVLKSSLGHDVALLLDSPYSSCCVDEVTAEHYESDGVIHFGASCLSPTKTLSVLNVFTKQKVDLAVAERTFQESFPDVNSHILLCGNTVYQHILGQLCESLSTTYQNVVCSYVPAEADNESATLCGRCFTSMLSVPLQSYSLFYFGAETDAALANFALTALSSKIVWYNPVSNKTGLYNRATRFLAKRWHAVEKLRDANFIGILVGTLAVDGYLDAIKRLKATAKLFGKKTCTISVGRPNVAKLANYPEISAYVYVACPEATLEMVTDIAKDFYQTVATPFEFEVAHGREWDGVHYVTDFHCLLKEPELVACETAEPEMSLITGQLRSNNNFLSGDNALVSKSNGALAPLHVGGGGEALAQRSWQGLDVSDLGSVEPVHITKGRSGIASSYDDEESAH